MFVPTPDKLPPVQWAAWLYVIHLCIGMLALCFVAVRLMSISEDEAYGRRMYPWFDKESKNRLWAEAKKLPSWLKQGAMAPEQDSRIASAVHGFGLIIILALGTTGVFFFLGLAPNGAMDEMTAFLRSTHEVLAIFLWLFLAGHIGMFVYHKSRGKKSIREIFTFEEKV